MVKVRGVLLLVLAYSLSGCSAVDSISNAMDNGSTSTPGMGPTSSENPGMANTSFNGSTIDESNKAKQLDAKRNAAFGNDSQ